jgi:sugar (pentulose or hexulose) kinase
VRELLVGIDVGTTNTKSVVLDVDGRELAFGRIRTPWTTVPTGAEIDPFAAVDAVSAVVAEALAAAPRGTVAGVGIAGLGETGVLLDAAGRPLAPAIAWHDARGGAEAARIAAALGGGGFAARTGLPASPLCTLSKLGWQRSNLPRAARASRWLGLPEWIARSLGAAEVSEHSLASRTGMFLIAERTWWPEALAWLGVREGFLPELVGGGVPIGRVGDALPGARGAILTVAGHDHVTATVGADAHAEGDVLHSCGTAEVFVRTLADRLDTQRVAESVAVGVTVGCHVVPDRWALLSGNELSVGLTSVLRMLGIDEPGQRDALDAAVAQLDADEPELQVRGLDGESAISLNGITSRTSPASVWRSALDAAAALSAATLARMVEAGGPTGRIVATGGGARGAATRSAKHKHLGPIDWSPVQEAAARGAALMAGVAAGVYASVDELPAAPSRQRLTRA